MKLKVMSYNIHNGFGDKQPDGKYKINKIRQKAAQKAVSKFHPDILILPEASFFQKNTSKVRQDYKKIFGYKYSVEGSNPYYKPEIDMGITILSKKKFTFSEDYTTGHVKFVRAKIRLNGKDICIDGVHPSPMLNDWRRAQIFKSILRDISKYHILAGDFNTFHPNDPYKYSELLKGFSKLDFLENPKQRAKEVLEGKPIKEILRHNLKDTFKETKKPWDYTEPLKSRLAEGWTKKRIDYIFCTKNFKVIDAGIIKTPDTEIASDHYPVYAVLEV